MRIAICAPVSLLTLTSSQANTPFKTEGLSSSIVTELALELHRRGHDLHVVTLSPDPRDVGTSRSDRLQVDVGFYRPRARSRALDLFREERSSLSEALANVDHDIIHAHWSYEFALAALQVDPESLITLHDWAPSILRQQRTVYRSLRLVMSNRAVSRAGHLSAVSPYVQSRAERRIDRPVHLVPNGISFTPNSDSQRPLSAAPVIGALNSGFGSRKNVMALLRAFAMVLEQQPDARLQLAGPGYEPSGPAERWATQRGLETAVDFLGPIPHGHVPKFMRGLDLFAHPSLEESFGLVLLEAMRESIPVVAGAQSGGVPWVLDSGKAGVLTDVQDPAQLCKSILGILGDRETARIIGMQGRESCIDRFSLDRVTSQYEHLYAEIVRQR